MYIAHNASYSSRLLLWQCEKCGKYFVYDKNYDKYYKITFPNWVEWHKEGDDNEK